MASRAQVVSVIATRMWDLYRYDLGGMDAAELRATIESQNGEGWTVDVQQDGDGRRWQRVAGVVLSESEIDEVVRAATTAD